MKKFAILMAFFVFAGFQLLLAQTVRISGTVTSSEDGLSVPGASIVVKGTTIGTVTDFEGKYAIDVPAGAQFLVFSFVGYSTQEVEIAGRTIINVQLQPGMLALEEIVVTALGISRERRALSYSVQGVSGDEVSDVKSLNLINALSGKVAGLQVTSGGGAIGSSSRVTIRGNSSFGNNQPLFVVDGTPISNFATGVSQWGGADYGNALMDIDPANIESISVLKGGMAAALYGQNAANGVILITTKDGAGRAQAFGVNVTSSVTFENPYIFPAYQNKYGQGLNGEEFRYNAYLTANGLTPTTYTYQQYAFDRTFRYYDGRGGGLYDGRDESWGARLDIGLTLPQFNSPYTLDANGLPIYENTPWVSSPDNTKDFFVTGLTYDNTVEVFGSTDKSNARLGISSMNATGTIPNTDLSRYSVNLSGNLQISDRLSARSNINYVKNFSDNLPGGGYSSDNVMQSIGGWFGRQVDMKALKDNWQTKDPWGYWYNWNQTYFSNPYFTANKLLKSRDRDRVFGNFVLDFKINDWLSLQGRLGNDYFSENRKEVFADGSIGIGVLPGGRFHINERSNNEFNADIFLNFDKRIGSDIRVDGLVGANYFKRTYRFQGIVAPQLTVPDLFTIGNVLGNPTASMYNSALVSNSVFGSFNVSFRNYLFLNASLRNDWSSSLAKDNWSYFYPGVGFGFVFSDALNLESDVFSYGKLRGSWAKIGLATGPYNTQGTYNLPADGPFRGVTQFFISRTLPPEVLKNETTLSYELGLDLAFLKRRISLDATYFNNLSKDQILAVDIAPSAGYTRSLLNAGSIRNQGVELILNGSVLRSTNGLNWDVTLNWTKIANEVIELVEGLETYRIATSWGALSIEGRPGLPYGTIMGSGFARDDQGRVIVHPTSGRVLKTPVPVEIGNTTPDWLGGIRNTFSYKNVSMSFLIDARIGGDIFSVTHWFGGYAGVAEFTAEGDIRENGLVVGRDVLANWGAVTAQVDGSGNIVRDENGFPVGSGNVNDIVLSTQTYFSDFWGNQEASIIDGSFIKLRELSVSYQVPKKVLNSVGFISDASISFVGRNLALLYKHKSNNINIDPETGFGTSNDGVGLEQYQIPSARSLGFKINLSF